MSVGIPDWNIKIDLEYEEGVEFDKEDREKARKAVEEALLWFMDGPLYILFDDECPDCLMVMEDGKNCKNKTCISNYEVKL